MTILSLPIKIFLEKSFVQLSNNKQNNKLQKEGNRTKYILILQNPYNSNQNILNKSNKFNKFQSQKKREKMS
jgi:hypothetical protein